MKKMIAAILIVLILICNLNINNMNIFANEYDIWDIRILDIKELDKLETNEEIALYTGDTQVVTHLDEPQNKEDRYLLINLYVNKLKNEQSVFDSQEIVLNVEDKNYKQIDNNFISKHKYKPFTQNEVKFGESEGYIVFEIPKNIDISNNSKIVLYNKKIDLAISNKDSNTKNTNIEAKENIIDEQWNIEKQILADYKLSSYTVGNPYIVQNPYKWAPLTSLVMFETDKEAKITIKVNGKDEYSDIEKTFDEYNIQHQIPIIGLYPNYDNQVEIIAEYRDKTIKNEKISIKTESLPDDFVNVELVKSNPEKMEEGMTFLATEGRVLIVDNNADIRWYLQHDNYLIFKRLQNGNMLISDERYGVQGRLGIYEIDLLGKVYNYYSDPVGIHHDVVELPNGNFLLTSSEGDQYVEDRIIELDRETGEIVNDINVRDILDTERFYTEGNDDWFHMNAIWYDETDQSIIISGAYQSIVCKISYPSGELKWILTEDDDFKKDLSDYILEPTGDGFKFQYAQHAPMILPNFDNNEDTVDILLYDNDSYRNYAQRSIDLEKYKEKQGKFSRSVHYRINEKEKTVEEIWSYGEERGRDYYTESVGDSDYLKETGNILTTFGDRSGYRDDNKLTTNTSTIVETDKNTPAEVIYEIDVYFNDKRRVYRSERLTLYPDEWSFKLGSYHGNIKINNTEYEEYTFADANIVKYEKSLSNGIIDLINIDDNKFNILGWQSLSGIESDKYNLSLVFISDKSSKSIDINTVSRPDVTAYLNNVLNDNVDYNNSGFNVYVSLVQLEENLEPGTYTVGVMIEAGDKKEYTETGYYFTIEDKEVKSQLVEDSDLLITQKQITNNIKTELEKNSYTLDNLYIINDPYKVSPLTYLISFNTEEKGTVEIEVKGKDESSNIKHKFEEASKQHIVPVYGLYPDYNNTVIIRFTNKNGEVTEKEINIQTDKLPEDIQQIEVKVADKENMKDGLTFTSSNYISAYDSNGDTRWYLSKGLVLDNATPIKRLQNGKLAIMSAKQIRPMYYQTGLYEIDLLGRINNEYIVDGIHHEIQELSNGNFIIASEKDEKTTEDYIVEIDRKTGKVKNSWDIGEILEIEEIADKTYQDRNYKDRALLMKVSSEEEIESAADHLNKHDWYHNNAVHYVESENTILASGRTKDTVIKFDAKTEKIKWILADPNSEWADEVKDKLLTPVGADFEWQYGQHAVTQLPNGDIMLYDNGNFRSKDLDKVLSSNENYSRAVIYRVNEKDMTVEQVWQYGKERGNELYTPYIGDVDYLDENHYLVNFGGIIKDEEGNKMDSPIELFNTPGAKGEAVIVEIKDDKVVNEFKLTHPFNANTYRVERLPMYYDGEGYFDLDKEAKRLGKHKETNTVDVEVTSETEDIMFETNKLVDEGDRLIANIDLINFNTDEDKMYIVLDNGLKKRVYHAKSKSDIIINKEGLSKASYEIGLLVVDKEGKEHYIKLDSFIEAKEGSKFKYYIELILSNLQSA